MSAAPGWYPDPGGQDGLFRYWDGQVWSPITTTNPYAVRRLRRLPAPGQRRADAVRSAGSSVVSLCWSSLR